MLHWSETEELAPVERAKTTLAVFGGTRQWWPRARGSEGLEDMMKVHWVWLPGPSMLSGSEQEAQLGWT